MCESILSWDVGIKNLAYCLIEKNDNKFKIKKWDVINLNDNIKPCGFIIRGGGTCSQEAKILINDNNTHNIYLYCKSHAEKYKAVFTKDVEKTVCCMGRCKSPAIEKPQDAINLIAFDKPLIAFGWCKDHIDKGKLKYISSIKKRKISGMNSMKQDLQTMTKKLYDILDKEPDFLKVSKILIENQPTKINMTMKTISVILFSYFVMRGVVEKVKNNSIIDEVKFVSPSNKLKVNKVTTDEILTKSNKPSVNKDKKDETLINDAKENDKYKNKNNIKQKDNKEQYKLTKNLGIKYCKSLIDANDLAILDSHKKKDDMCDSFLQGFQFLFNPVPDNYMDKLKTIGMTQI